jgi:hypothetical protein
LAAEGVLTYVTNLYLPVLAGNINEAMFNVKSEVNDNPAVNASYFELNSNGLFAKNASEIIPSDDLVTIPFGGNVSTQDWHLMLRNQNTLLDLASGPVDFVGDVSSADGERIFGGFKNGTYPGFEFKHSATGNLFITDEDAINLTPDVKGVMSDTVSRKVIGSNGLIYNYNGIDSPYLSGDLPFSLRSIPFLVNYQRDTKVNRLSCGFFSMGKAMPDAVATKYHELTTLFFENF